MPKQIAAADGANTAKGQPTPAAETQTQQGSTDDILAAMLAEEGAQNPEGIDPEPAASADGAEVETEDLSHSESEEGSQQDEADEPEATEETEEEPAEAEEKPEEADGKANRVQKRIDKLTAKNARLKEENEELRKQLESKPSKTEGATPASSELPEFLRDDPKVVSVLQEQHAAERELEIARNLKRQLREDPEGVLEMLAKAGRTARSAEDAADFLDDYVQKQRERLSESRVALGARRQEVEAQRQTHRAQMDALATNRAPWLSDDEDPRTVQVERLLKANPRLAAEPAARFIAVAVVKEMAAMKAADALRKQKPKTTAATTTVPRTAATAGNGRPAAVAPKSVGTKAAALQRLVENPSEDSLAEALEAELESR